MKREKREKKKFLSVLSCSPWRKLGEDGERDGRKDGRDD